MTATLPVSVTLIKASEAAWSTYATACRTRDSTDADRLDAYQYAITAQRAVWAAEGNRWS